LDSNFEKIISSFAWITGEMIHVPVTLTDVLVVVVAVVVAVV